jgi:Flp pilus assembly protein TadB
MPRDATLTPYERKSWKKLQRQLEADGSAATAPRSPSRGVALVLAVVAVLMVLVAAVIGGTVAVAAVALYLCVSLTLWGLARVVWRT